MVDHPPILDCLWVDRDIIDQGRVGGAVLQAASLHFEYHVFLKPRWRDDPMSCAELDWRRAAVSMTGLTHSLERLRFEWTVDIGLPASSNRLTFSSASDDIFLNVFAQVARDSLDEGTRTEVARLGVEEHAQHTLARNRRMRGDRSWWRIARTPDGQVAGFTIPSANEDFPVIGYLGVVPDMRGRGYSVDLLAEATRILAANGAERVRADTDAANIPMASAFLRASYRQFGVRLVIAKSPEA